MRDVFKRLLVAILFVSVVVAIHVSGMSEYVSFEAMRAHRQLLVLYVAQHYYPAVLLYVVCYACAVACFLPAATFMTMVGGFLFGMRAAIPYVITAATLGAVISFLLIRYMIGAVIQQRYVAQLQSFNKAVEKAGVFYLLMVRFIPLIPFAVINVLAGLTRLSLWNFVWTTAVGIVPTTFVFTYAGRQLAAVDSVSDLLSLPMLIALGSIMALASLSLLLESRLKSW